MGLMLEISLAVLGAVVAVLIHTLERRAERRAAQRLLFAEALSDVFRWMEFPYRIRRRSPGAESRRALADDMNEMQERIRFRSGWLEIEDAVVFRAYQDLLGEVRKVVRPALKDAWESAPVTEDVGMNLNLNAPLWDAKPIDERARLYLAAARGRFRWWKVWT
jgi:hypothetical protein